MITPLEIQNHKFSAKLRGYAPEEVKHFLYAVSEEFENLMEQNHNMSRELTILRERLKNMESRDRVLKDTLVTAQQIKTDIHTNAEKEAELIVKEAQLKAERLYDEAREEVARIRHQASEVRRMRNDLLAEAELMVSRFNHFVEAEQQEARESDKIHEFAPRPRPARDKKESARRVANGKVDQLIKEVQPK